MQVLGLPFFAWFFLAVFLFLFSWVAKDYRTGIARGLGKASQYHSNRSKDPFSFWQTMVSNSLFAIVCLVLAAVLAFPKTFPQWNAYLAGKTPKAVPFDGPEVPRPN